MPISLPATGGRCNAFSDVCTIGHRHCAVGSLSASELRRLFTEALDQYWDEDAYEAVLAQEGEDLETLDGIIVNLD